MAASSRPTKTLGVEKRSPIVTVRIASTRWITKRSDLGRSALGKLIHDVELKVTESAVLRK